MNMYLSKIKILQIHHDAINFFLHSIVTENVKKVPNNFASLRAVKETDLR